MTNINKHFERLILETQIGQELKEVEPIYGGALHKIWKVTTKTDVFAVKEINEHIAEKETFLNSYEVSEEISYEFKKEGIPAVSAIKVNNHFAHKIDSRWYIIYPYVNANLCPFEKLTEAQLQSVGSIFAKMHNLNLQIKGVDTGHYDYFNDQHWVSLIVRSNNNELRKNLDFILHCNQRFEQAINFLKLNQIVTHRDMHSLNVLWDAENRPYVIDWETAGLMNPILEIVGYGIEWGGVIQGNFQKNNTQILFQQYKREINKSISEEQIKYAFYGWVGHCIMGWTEFNIRRMLGLTSQDPQEQKIGHDIINNKMLRCIQYISTHENKLFDLASEELIIGGI